MALDQFSSYQKRADDTKAKFMMPLGWGWTYPFVKYTSMILLSIKMSTGIPWYKFIFNNRLPFFIVSAFMVRLLMAPLMIRQMILVHRMAKVI